MLGVTSRVCLTRIACRAPIAAAAALPRSSMSTLSRRVQSPLRLASPSPLTLLAQRRADGAAPRRWLSWTASVRNSNDSQAGDSAAAESPFKGQTVVEGTMLNWEAVVKHSNTTPVILDLYADWCEPCKQLTPELVARAQKAKGKVLLVKINVDKEDRIAESLRVQSLPTVFCIYQGQSLGGFVGLKTPAELDQFFAKVLAAKGADSKEEDLLDQAQQAYEEGDIAGASQVLSQILANQDSSQTAVVSAYALLIHCGLAEKNLADCKLLVDGLKSKYAAVIENHAGAQQAISAYELASSTASASSLSVDELKKQIAANPKDADLRHQLALAYLAQSRFEEGLEQCLEAIKCNRTHNDAKQLLFKSLETLGPDHPLTPTTRRRLGNILFT